MILPDYDMNEEDEILNEKYLSIRNFLVCQEKIPCELTETILSLKESSILCRGEELNELMFESGTKLNINLWLLQMVKDEDRESIQIEMPTSYRQRVLEVLHADAKCVDFSQLTIFFYDLLIELAQFRFVSYKTIVTIILEAFRSRFHLIMNESLHTADGSLMANEDLVRKFCSNEKQLFMSGKYSAEHFLHWLLHQQKTIRSYT
ncbi:hypothetical protein SNEBB_007688 [Seison nebaliae]|nr:hypothetical protein SNEBB_007688 [Seison nebaliae]